MSNVVLGLLVKNLPAMKETTVQFLGWEPEGIGSPPQYSWASLMAQTISNPSAMQERWV